MAVSLVVTGMQNYPDIDENDAAPLATAFDAVGHGVDGPADRHRRLHRPDRGGDDPACSARPGSRFAMARDGLLPRGLAKVHPTFGTPYIITAITGVARRGHRRLRRPRHPGQPGQHRHAVRLRPGQRRRGHPAPEAPGPAPLVPDARRDVGRRPLGAAVRLPDAQPHRRHLGAVPGLDGHRPGRLLRLRPHATAGSRGPSRRSARRAEGHARTYGDMRCRATNSAKAAGPRRRVTSPGGAGSGHPTRRPHDDEEFRWDVEGVPDHGPAPLAP